MGKLERRKRRSSEEQKGKKWQEVLENIWVDKLGKKDEAVSERCAREIAPNQGFGAGTPMVLHVLLLPS